MKLNPKKQVCRLVIYFFYDADGIVDRYVPYMLEDIKRNCTELFIVCNGKLTPEGRETFRKFTPHILVRENVGFDVWAYKEALEHYGWDKLAEFDEVVLMNYTIMGPLYPLSEMFETMNQRDVDFWGITKHHGFPFDPFGTVPGGVIPEHIQSSFICVRNSMLNSMEFHAYWEKMQPVNSYGEAVGKHEAIFTRKFEDFGYVSDIYIQTDDLKEYTHYPLMIKSLELVKNRRCPIFKRKAFSNEYYEFLNCCLGEPTVELYEYIRGHTNYDTDMIWENILRIDNMADIKNRMHLNYILPKNNILCPKEDRITKILLVMHIYYEDQISYCLEYAMSMPENADIILTTCSEKNLLRLQKESVCLRPRKINIIKIENRGRDVSALLVAAAPYIDQYELVCFAHDKKSKQMIPYTMGESFSYKCFENVLGSRQYVKNIIDTFAHESHLGLLMPPPPNHAGFYGVLGTEWGGNYNNTLFLLDSLDLRSNIPIDKEPISPLGTMFWFRPQALRPLFQKKWNYKDFPEEPNLNDGTILHAIERAYGIIPPTQGFYTGWCMHDKFAAIELTNYHFMARETAMSFHTTLGFQAGFNLANYNLANKFSLRNVIKNKIKAKMPKPIWNFFRKIYHLFGGKKWVG